MNSQDNAKAQLGKNATAIWLVGGAALFLLDGGFTHLFSLRALAFLGIGMFVAAIVVGSISYLLLNTLATRLMARYPDPASVEAQSAMAKWRNFFGLANAALAVIFLVLTYAGFFWR